MLLPMFDFNKWQSVEGYASGVNQELIDTHFAYFGTYS